MQKSQFSFTWVRNHHEHYDHGSRDNEWNVLSLGQPTSPVDFPIESFTQAYHK